jgi:hypothetical protein
MDETDTSASTGDRVHLDPSCLRLHPLADYARRLPSSRIGKRLNRATLWRWALRGIKGSRLRTVALGGGRMTCDAWVWQFMRGTDPCSSQLGNAHPLGSDERMRIAQALGVARRPTSQRSDAPTTRG